MTIFCPAPYRFVGIGLGSISGKVLHLNSRVFVQPRTNYQRLGVDLASIPDNRQMSAHFTFKLLQKEDNFFRMKVLVRRQEHEMQPHSQRFRAKGNRTDDRDSVTPSRAIQNWRLPARRQRASNHGSDQKARFVQQSDMGAPFTRLPKNPGPLHSGPTLHFCVIAFPGMLLRSLAGPVQSLSQQSDHVIWMVLYPEVATNQRRYPCSRPKLVAPSIRRCAFQKQRFQMSQLMIAQSGWTAWDTFGKQATRRSLYMPAVYRTNTHSQNPSNDRRRLSLVYQLDGT